MRLVHFSKNPFVFFDRGRDYKNRDYSSRFNKPNGLWLSDEDAYGWSELVTTENWTGKEDTLAYGIDFEVLDWSRVLHIKGELDFIYFIVFIHPHCKACATHPNVLHDLFNGLKVLSRRLLLLLLLY